MIISVGYSNNPEHASNADEAAVATKHKHIQLQMKHMWWKVLHMYNNN